MTARFRVLLLSALVVGTLLIAGVSAQNPADAPPPPPTLLAPDGVEVMARGPVHEGYAEPGEVRPQPSPLVTKQPPEPINELPPDQRPEGDNVQWIPGYWGWDQDRSDYLWVSGFWRMPPPGRQWVPGNWQPVEGGFHWVAGFWTPIGQNQMQYLPTPPPSVDQGPSIPAPQANSSYVPGCWVHRETRYWWRPGFWAAYHPGWVWIPAHYVWTPGGCLFVEGYWDHPLEARGLLFAPVRLARRLLTAEQWLFTPRYVVHPDFLMGALFVRPSFGHYYFGDYFEDRYTRAGFVPWIDYRVGRFAYDPNFNYYRQGFSGYGTWERGIRGLYQARFQGDIPRPPRTLVQQNLVVRNITINKTNNVFVNKNISITNVQNVSVLTPLTQIHNTRVTNLASLANVRDSAAKSPLVANPVWKMQAVSREQRAQEQKSATQFHAVAQQRRQVEGRLLSEGTAPRRVTDPPRPGKIDLPRVAPQPAPRPGERPVTPIGIKPGERPVPPVTIKPSERPKPPVTPKPSERPVTPKPAERPTPPVHVTPPVRIVPPPPAPPKHEDRPIPKHEPPKAPAPPKHAPPPKPPAPTKK